VIYNNLGAGCYEIAPVRQERVRFSENKQLGVGGKEVNSIDWQYPEETCTEALGEERIVAPVGVCPIDSGRSLPDDLAMIG